MSIFHYRFAITLLAFALSFLAGCSGCQKETVDEVEQAAKVDRATSEKSDSDSSASGSEDQSARTDDVSKPEENASTNSPQKTSVAAPSPAQPTISNSDSGGQDMGTTNAEEARKQAEELYKKSQSQSDNPGRAFQDASRAWEILSQHPDNAECQAMAAEIAGRLEIMASKANEPYRGKLSDDRTLIEK